MICSITAHAAVGRMQRIKEPIVSVTVETGHSDVHVAPDLRSPYGWAHTHMRRAQLLKPLHPRGFRRFSRFRASVCRRPLAHREAQ